MPDAQAGSDLQLENIWLGCQLHSRNTAVTFAKMSETLHNATVGHLQTFATTLTHLLHVALTNAKQQHFFGLRTHCT
jgi:hypothetical protein